MPISKLPQREKPRREPRPLPACRQAAPAAQELGQPSVQIAETDSLATDILRGAEAIARYVGLDVRQCFYRLEQGDLPAVKEGAVWVTTKSRLRKHYNGEQTEQKREAVNTIIQSLSGTDPKIRGIAIRHLRLLPGEKITRKLTIPNEACAPAQNEAPGDRRQGGGRGERR